MPDQPRSQDSSTPGPDLEGGLTDAQIDRLAEMIADDRCEFPRDLSSLDAQRLSMRVSRRLRDRLIRLIAQAIADHLDRATGPLRETTQHARTSL